VKRLSKNVPKRFGAHFWGGLFCFQTLLPKSRTKMDATAAESMNLRTMPCNACRNATRNVMVAIHLKHERSFYGLTCALISKNLACAGKVAGGFVRHRAQHLRTSFRTHADVTAMYSTTTPSAHDSSKNRLSTGALKLKEFIEKHSIGKVDEVTKVLREQQVTNIVAMKKLPRKWLVENLGEDAARDILTASVDEQVTHPPTHSVAHPISKMAV
jgi:hypothetical protein